MACQKTGAVVPSSSLRPATVPLPRLLQVFVSIGRPADLYIPWYDVCIKSMGDDEDGLDLCAFALHDVMLRSLLVHSVRVVQQLSAFSSRNDTLSWLFSPSWLHQHHTTPVASHQRDLAPGGSRDVASVRATHAVDSGAGDLRGRDLGDQSDHSASRGGGAGPEVSEHGGKQFCGIVRGAGPTPPLGSKERRVDRNLVPPVAINRRRCMTTPGGELDHARMMVLCHRGMSWRRWDVSASRRCAGFSPP